MDRNFVQEDSVQPYPHDYTVQASGSPDGAVPLSGAGLPRIESAPPPEFGGPGGAWSPETLLVAAVADCFILTFRAVSRAAKFPWQKLDCSVDGRLERVDGVTQFSRFNTRATLTVDAGADHAKAHELLERSEKACLVANSLRGERHLEAQIIDAVN